jgi:hypothetical protein
MDKVSSEATHGDGCIIDEDVDQLKMGDDPCCRMWSEDPAQYADHLIPSRISEASTSGGLCRCKVYLAGVVGNMETR